MKKFKLFMTYAAVGCLILALFNGCGPNSSKTYYTVTLADAVNGSVTVTPKLKADGKVKEGTVIKVTAEPASGYLLDASFYGFANPEGRVRRIESSLSELNIPVTGDVTVGATFIEAEKLKGVNVTYDVVYAQPGVKKLKYDVYSPQGASNLPCLVIIHGGGWSSNTEEVMRGLSRDLVATGKYVVFNIDYRWINTGDGDEVPNTMADLIGDIFGAIAHIQEHAGEYGGDPTRIGVTGDSAGGHLSASAANMCNLIGDGGFGRTPGVYQFLPTYIPQGKTAADVNREITNAIKAAAPSYGVFAGELLQRFSSEGGAALDAISPQANIPNIKDRAVPQFLLRGSEDQLITDEAVRSYAAELEAAGQTAYLVTVEGAGHAFLDWKTDERTQNTYNTIGHKYAVEMRDFFDSVFYN